MSPKETVVAAGPSATALGGGQPAIVAPFPTKGNGKKNKKKKSKRGGKKALNKLGPSTGGDGGGGDGHDGLEVDDENDGPPTPGPSTSNDDNNNNNVNVEKSLPHCAHCGASNARFRCSACQHAPIGPADNETTVSLDPDRVDDDGQTLVNFWLRESVSVYYCGPACQEAHWLAGEVEDEEEEEKEKEADVDDTATEGSNSNSNSNSNSTKSKGKDKGVSGAGDSGSSSSSSGHKAECLNLRGRKQLYRAAIILMSALIQVRQHASPTPVATADAAAGDGRVHPVPREENWEDDTGQILGGLTVQGADDLNAVMERIRARLPATGDGIACLLGPQDGGSDGLYPHPLIRIATLMQGTAPSIVLYLNHFAALLLEDTATNLQEVKFQLQGDAETPNHHPTHRAILATLPSGETFVIDPTGWQHGHHFPVLPWAESYAPSLLLPGSEIECRPLGYAHARLLLDTDRAGTLAAGEGRIFWDGVRESVLFQARMLDLAAVCRREFGFSLAGMVRTRDDAAYLGRSRALLALFRGYIPRVLDDMYGPEYLASRDHISDAALRLRKAPFPACCHRHFPPCELLRATSVEELMRNPALARALFDGEITVEECRAKMRSEEEKNNESTAAT